MKFCSSFILCLSIVGLTGCSDGMNQYTSVVADADQVTPSPAPLQYNTQVTIREIMATLIDPHADALWNSVKVVSDESGIIEYFPESDEEWQSLRQSAISIIEGSNALMMPGRAVAPPGASGIFPDYEFTPAEVEEKLAEDRLSWIGFSRNLQDAAIELLNAVDEQDTNRLTEWGAYLDEACESCHSVYWYREGI